MSAAIYILGGAAGLAFSTLVAYLNSLITKRYLNRNKDNQGPEGTAAAMGLTFIRQLVNIAALAIVFFMRNIVPLPFIATAIGTVIGLTAVSILLVYRLTDKFNRQ